MKASYPGVVLVAALALGSCHGTSTWLGDDIKPHRGRYTGIGIYSTDRMWSEITVADKPKDKAAATTADDRTVIVVVDSDTGEIRQCGNLSGYCIGMNPWNHALAGTQAAPLSLDKHAAELEASSSNDVAPVGNAVAR
ncbi:hypothetical protein GCM10009087_43440 [Sphingomonas oligophenolica]|uniref:Lipoprotein n=1 Tax=Sphingomonas oligophenolica TaxID=301154 RepID=A0ABU9XZP6_9SPHN